MKKDEAQRNFDEKRKTALEKLRTLNLSEKELEDTLKNIDTLKEMKDLAKALENLNKAKD